eukprot:2902316-Pleurochrysis_carterae.AAC.2
MGLCVRAWVSACAHAQSQSQSRARTRAPFLFRSRVVACARARFEEGVFEEKDESVEYGRDGRRAATAVALSLRCFSHLLQ